MCHRRMSLDEFNIGVHRTSLRTALYDFYNLECIACLCGLDAVEVDYSRTMTSYSKCLFELVAITCLRTCTVCLCGLRFWAFVCLCGLRSHRKGRTTSIEGEIRKYTFCYVVDSKIVQSQLQRPRSKYW